MIEKPINPVTYFEIPVQDMKRAMKFYKAVFGYDFFEEEIDGNQMSHFPLFKEATGISGSLAKGDIYKPTQKGILIYFNTNNIDETIINIRKNGGEILYPKTDVGEYGYVAEFQDTEGNRIALHMKKCNES